MKLHTGILILMFFCLVVAFGCGAGGGGTNSGGQAVAQAGSGQTATSNTLAALNANNTSASDSFNGTVNGNPKAGNVSKLPITQLLYPGATTKVYAHYMPWWGTSGHINIGLNETDPAVVTRQVQDADSRGFAGFIIDWYGPTNTPLDTATKNVKAAAEATSDFEFAICEDSGSLTGNANPTAKLLSDIQYMNDTYFSSPRYIRWQNRPVVAFFLNTTLNIDWATVRAQAAGNPVFIFRDAGGFTTMETNGSFNWVGITGNPQDMGLSYVDGFYQAALAHNSEMVIGSAYKGFNDSIAPWGAHRVVNQQCGQTWLATFAEVNKYYSSSNQLPFMQLPTWNDYEEGSEIETGIDNCVAVSATLSGQTLAWSISGGQENTLDHYEIYLSPDGQNLNSLTQVPAGTHSVNLAGYQISSGSSLYVQAVAKPGLLNHTSAAVVVK